MEPAERRYNCTVGETVIEWVWVGVVVPKVYVTVSVYNGVEIGVGNGLEGTTGNLGVIALLYALVSNVALVAVEVIVETV